MTPEPTNETSSSKIQEADSKSHLVETAGLDSHDAQAADQSDQLDCSSDAPVSKRVKTPFVVVLAIIVVACLVAGIAGGVYLVNTYAQIKDVENSKAMEPTLPEEINAGQANPIDFTSLSKQNPDIYAWIYLPGTDINFPVCQSQDDTYYLTRNAAREETELGAIFSESRFNHTDFRDPVTILYGHNGYGNTMFTALHQFEHSDFFQSHEKVYVYTAGHVFTYEIAGAFMATDQHLMGLYNFQTDEGFAQFASLVKNPNVIGANTRDVEITADSKLLVLSTCNTGALEATGRYLVCGVMVDDRAIS